jgi:hypothetical protein
MINRMRLEAAIEEMQGEIHQDNVDRGWWNEISTASKVYPEGEPTPKTTRVFLEKCALIHSEVSEAVEGKRKGLMDDHLPHRPMEEVELADTIIRILDLSGAFGLDVAGAIFEKLEYNKTRADHKIENRLKEGGKKS